MIRLFHIILLAASCYSHHTGAALYRWVDENGEVHYSDKVSPDQAKHPRTKLNPQGREIAVIEGAKSLDRLNKEQQLAQLRQEQNRILAEQRDQDLSLLRTYRSEEEIQRTLQNRLKTLDALIKINEANRQRHQELLLGQEKRAAEMERQGQIIPRTTLDNISATRRQVANYDETIKRLQVDKQFLTGSFAKDIDRFKAIKAQDGNIAQQLRQDLTVLADDSVWDDLLISAIRCPKNMSDQAWSMAKTYVLQNLNTKLAIDTDRVLQTPKPFSDQDIALIVTRMPEKNEDILFLDILCRQSAIGHEICAGPQVRQIREGFKPFIEESLGKLFTNP
jgi:hypothetical protein